MKWYGTGVALVILSGVAWGQTLSPVSSSTDQTDAAKKKAAASQLDTLVVQNSALTSTDIAAHDLAQVPGGTNLITDKDVADQRNFTIADLLARQPGVYSQAAGGTPAVKISIRGSGVNAGAGGAFRTGILFLFDGLPLTTPGGTPYELLDPNGLAHTEVLRGANGFNYQSEQLGGAINFVSHTGYDSSPFQARFDAGSFGYAGGQLSSGLVEGPYDYFINVDSSTEQGFQNHSEENAIHLNGNFGAKIDDDLDTRFLYRYGYTDNQSPGSLTKAQIKNDPTASAVSNTALDSYRVQPGSFWLANKTTLKIDPDSSITLGSVFHNYPIQQFSYGRSGTSLGTSTRWWYTALAESIRYDREDEILGHDSKTSLGFMVTGEPSAGVKTYDASGGQKYVNLLKNRNFDGSTDGVITASNEFELVPHLWLVNGIGGVYTYRATNISKSENLTATSATSPITVQASGPAWSRNYALLDWQGRTGLRYDITPDWNAYATLSRSIDTPNDWALTNSSAVGGHQANDSSQVLHNQSATTFEVGTKGQQGPISGSFDVYRSWVDNELLTVVIDPIANVTASSNASPTIHQGVETGLDIQLWKEKGLPADTPHQLVLSQTYTYSDFHYVHDRVFGHNTEPGIPPHLYQAELLYQHSSGFYAGFDAQVTSSTTIDYANTLDANGWATFGFKLGYAQPKKGWETHLQFTNITNEHYASAIQPTYNAKGVDGAYLAPGDGFGGVSYDF